MADTICTTSALLALAPDNTSGEISPQDLRDFMVSAFNRLDDSLAKKTDATSTFQNSASAGTTLSVRSNNSAQNGVLSALGSSGSGLYLRSNNSNCYFEYEYSMSIFAPTSASPKTISIFGGDSAANNTTAGSVSIYGGNATTSFTNSHGGNVTLAAGNANNEEGAYGGGGSITLLAGLASGEYPGAPGGTITLQAGQGSDGAAGNNGSNGGSIGITAGSGSCSDGTGNGGSITLTSGEATGYGTSGAYIQLTGASSTPGEVFIYSPSNCNITMTQVDGITLTGLNGLSVTLKSYQSGIVVPSITQKGIAVYSEIDGFLGYIMIHEDLTS